MLVGVVGVFQALEICPRVNILFEQIRERLVELSGAESAAAGQTPPLSGWGLRYGFTIEGRKTADSEKEALRASWFPVSVGYFRTLGIPLLRGRDLRLEDNAAGPGVVIINDTMARRFWPGGDPIGQRVLVGLVNEQPREIVGVVGDVRQNRYDREPQLQMYVPHTQQPHGSQGRYADSRMTMTFVVRSARDPLRLVPAFRSAVAGVDRRLPISNIKTVEDYVVEQLQEPRQYMTLLTLFSGIAVALALVGVYGIMSYSVRQRTHEIGIRVALGAAPVHVLRLVIGRGLLLIALGTVIGLAGSLLLTRLLKSYLWGVTPTDLATFILVMAAVVSSGLLACYLPARRALRIDPLTALRHE